MKFLSGFVITSALLWSAFAESAPAQALTNSNNTQTAAEQLPAWADRKTNPSGLFASEEPSTVTQTYKQTAEKLRAALKNDPQAKRARFILFVGQPPAQVAQ